MLKVTCAIIVREGKLLITQRGPDSEHPREWEFPGGKVKCGETEEASILREIMEELNVELRIIRKLYPVEYDYGFRKIELIPFLGGIETGEIQLNGHSNFAWVEFPELKNVDLSAADRELIKNPGNRKFLEKYLGENMHDTR